MDVLKRFSQPQTELDIAIVHRYPRTLPWVRFALAVGVVTCTFTLNTLARAASFTGLGYLSMDSRAGDVSADGSTVIGWSDNRAFLWTQATGMRALNFPSGANYGEATGISADGTTVVGLSAYIDPTTGEGTGYQAFRWTESTGTVGLGTIPGSNFSMAYGTSADGSIVVGNLFGGNQEGFRWTAAGMTGLGYLSGDDFNFSTAIRISDNGQFIAGASGTNDADGNIYKLEATRWNSIGEAERLGILPGHFTSEAWGISADGSTVVGNSGEFVNVVGDSGEIVGVNFLQEAFRWNQTTGMMDALGRLDGATIGSFAWDVSADGSTVVGYADDADRGYAVMWTPDSGLQKVQQILMDAGVDLTGWRLRNATGISNDGRKIVGYGTNPDGKTEAWLADLDSVPKAVPTPALLPGLLAIAYKTHRKRKHQAIA
jgi:uncharacterized membrane protein